jgi:hypothetical protein
MPGGIAEGEMTAQRPARLPFLKNRLRHFRALLSSIMTYAGKPGFDQKSTAIQERFG